MTGQFANSQYANTQYSTDSGPIPAIIIAIAGGGGDTSRKKYLEWLKKKQTKKRLQKIRHLAENKGKEAILPASFSPPPEIATQIDRILQDLALEKEEYKRVHNYMLSHYKEIIERELILLQEEDEEDIFMMINWQMN